MAAAQVSGEARADNSYSAFKVSHDVYTRHGLPYMGYRTWVMVHGLRYMPRAASLRAWRATRGFYSAASEVARRASRGTVRLGIVRVRESLRTRSGEKNLRLVAPGTRAVAAGAALLPLLHSVRQTGQ